MDGQVQWIRELGRGAYGKVWQVQDTVDEKEYALKVIKIKDGKDDQGETLREVRALSLMEQHQNTVRYYHSWLTDVDCPSGPDSGDDIETETASTSASVDDATGISSGSVCSRFLWIKLELCDLSLRTWIDDLNRASMPLSTILNVFFQLTVVIKFIHVRQNLIHRDLKPENIMLKKRWNQPPQVKVGDFGLVSLPKGGNRNANGFSELTASLGTYPYAAPEMSLPANASHMGLDAVKYDAKVDVYAMGIILMELLFPFATRSELYAVCREIVDNKKFPISVGNGQPDAHKEEKGRIVKMMEPDPEFRPEAQKIHIWMKSYNKSAPICTCHPCK